MTLSERQLSQLNKAIAVVQDILASAQAESKAPARKQKSSGKRYRRSAADAAKLRKDVLAARKKGVPASALAKKYGVSSAYIYMIA